MSVCVCVTVCVCMLRGVYSCLIHASFSVTASIADQIEISFDLTVIEGLSDISQD